MLNKDMGYLKINLEELSNSEIELWVFKSVRLYNEKMKDKEKMQIMLDGVSYIIKEREISKSLENILLSLEDNLKYDLKELNYF